MVIGAATPFGPLLAVSNVLLGAVWLWFTINGFAAARQRRFADHRRHMVRSATVALSTISQPDLDADAVHHAAAVAGQRL